MVATSAPEIMEFYWLLYGEEMGLRNSSLAGADTQMKWAHTAKTETLRHFMVIVRSWCEEYISDFATKVAELKQEMGVHADQRALELEAEDVTARKFNKLQMQANLKSEEWRAERLEAEERKIRLDKSRTETRKRKAQEDRIKKSVVVEKSSVVLSPFLMRNSFLCQKRKRSECD